MTSVETSSSPLPDPHDLSKVIVKGQQVLGFFGARKQRTSLSVQTKLDVIKYAEENPTVTQNKIATHFGIDRTTVSKVLKRKAQLKVSEPEGKPAFSGISRESSEHNDQSSDSTELNEVVQNPNRSRRSTLRSNTAAVPKHMKHDFHLSRLAPKNTQHMIDTTQDLYDKCESWFMKQKLTTASKKHEKDIITYSCLISPLPLSVENCGRIISAKFVKDEAFQWIYRQLAIMDPGSQSLTVLEGRGEELLTKYLQEELSPLNKKLSKVLPGSCPSYSAPDVRRVWLQYVNPKLHMFEEAEQHVIESIETHAQQHFGVMPPTKKPKLAMSGDPTSSNQLLQFIGGNLINSAPMQQPLLLVPSTPNNVTSPLSASSHISMTSPHAASPHLLLPLHPPTSMPSSASTSPVLAEVSRSQSVENGGGQVLDLSTNEGHNGDSSSKGLDLTRSSPDEKGNGVRGSRKRKMNSNPVRITQQDMEESVQAENGEVEAGQKSSDALDMTKHPELMRCLDGAEYKSKSGDGVTNGYLDDRSDHPVIEIVPDRYRSAQPKHSGILRQKLTTNCSNADNCDNNNLHSDISNNNNRSQAIHGILNSVSSLSEQFAKFQSYVQKMDEALKEQRSEKEKYKCDCEANSQFEKRISSLEEKVEAMQTTLDKLCNTVMETDQPAN